MRSRPTRARRAPDQGCFDGYRRERDRIGDAATLEPALPETVEGAHPACRPRRLPKPVQVRRRAPARTRPALHTGRAGGTRKSRAGGDPTTESRLVGAVTRAARPVALLEHQAPTRVPELVPIRYGRMLTSPFAFFRGAAYIMAADLAAGARSGLRVQLCGDAHLSNFGSFAARDRRIVLSINDFDETLPGPFEWDVKRLAASFAVAGRPSASTKRSGARRPRRGTLVPRRDARVGSEGVMDTWYARLEMGTILERWGRAAGKKQVKKTQRVVNKAQTKDSMKALGKLTKVVDGRPRIVGDPPWWSRSRSCCRRSRRPAGGELRSIIRSYRRTLPRDRRKLSSASTTSTPPARSSASARSEHAPGSPCSPAATRSDPLFLQFKEAQTSVLEPFLGKSEYANHGQRIVEGQRMMQSASDSSSAGTASRVSTDRTGLLRPSALGREGVGRHRGHGSEDDRDLRRDLRLDARPRPRTLGRRDRDRVVPRDRRHLRPGDGDLRGGIRRPERARLRRA